MEKIDPAELEVKLLYEFKDKTLLDEALCHSSFVNEQINSDLVDNERLEFLGDAVLNLAVGHILMKRFPDLKEGDLSRMRSNLVNESQLAEIARSIDLGAYIRLGKGEIQTKGREKNSILADTFEAVTAAIYIEAGFDAVFNIIDSHFASKLNSIETSTVNRDYKSQLQELVQTTHKVMPSYRVVCESGPDHNKIFNVQVTACGLQTEGAGRSKKAAEQDAARKALDVLLAR